MANKDLADPGEARGLQELYTRQAPQKLTLLREHALKTPYRPTSSKVLFQS